MIALGDIAVIGGGCYGTFYVGQLERAREAGALDYRRLLVVDRDPACAASRLPADPARHLVVEAWDPFLDGWVDAAARDRDGLEDMVVPSPLMPHLFASWLERAAGRRWAARRPALRPVETPLGTPFDLLHDSGTRYVSFADWLCPTHCIEPHVCPAIRAPRTWEMGDALTAWTAARGATHRTAGPALFTCRHVTYGVGMYPVRRAFEAIALLEALAGSPEHGDLVIGSVSACHGAMAILHLEKSSE